MTATPGSGWAPIVLLLVVLLSDVWVYTDAKARAGRDDPVVVSIGSFVVETPLAWFAGAVLLWIVFFPLYLTARAR